MQLKKFIIFLLSEFIKRNASYWYYEQ